MDMKKPIYFLLLLLVLLSIVGGYVIGTDMGLKINPKDKITTPSITVTSAMSPSPKIISVPLSLRIPKLNIVTRVEHVGEDASGRMDVPKDVNNVAWWQHGAKPGEMGSAVFAGHYDTRTGQPAVFYSLKSLVAGDEIKIMVAGGEEYSYIVTDLKIYEDKSFPLNYVFTRSDKARLNLITCEGIFDRSNNMYDKRLVVFSELQ